MCVCVCVGGCVCVWVGVCVYMCRCIFFVGRRGYVCVWGVVAEDVVVGGCCRWRWLLLWLGMVGVVVVVVGVPTQRVSVVAQA